MKIHLPKLSNCLSFCQDRLKEVWRTGFPYRNKEFFLEVEHL